MANTQNTPEITFAQLLEQAISEPGKIHDAYRAFHGYSLGNRMLALAQCNERELPLGPIATYNRWKERGRHVVKGAKALTLCMPVTCKRKAETEGEDDATFTRFVFRRNWFVMAQTEGEPFQDATDTGWDRTRALATLSVTEEPFALMDGNCQGYARERTIAINPVAAMPLKTLFHELAHILLGHTAEGALTDDERTPRSLREVEAESVAMLVSASLQLPGVEYSRGYIQNWNESGQPIPERSASKIFKVADQIIKAGLPTADNDKEE